MRRAVAQLVTGGAIWLLPVGHGFAEDGTGRTASAFPQSDIQHGFSITLNRVSAGTDGVRLHVVLDNRGKETVYFYDVNTEIRQGEERYEPQAVWGSSEELPGRVPPGSRVAGVIPFPSLAPDGGEILIRFPRPAGEGDRENWHPVEFRCAPPFPGPVPPDSTGPDAVPPKTRLRKVVIIKADDLTAPSANWDRFIEVSLRRGIKVSVGIICNSLRQDEAGYYAWLRARQQSGAVEFWSHGWDHERLGAGRSASEYMGSGYGYQKKHLADSQEIMTKVLGIVPVAFGTPWNEFDRDTVRIVDEDPDVRLFFGHKEGILRPGKVVVRLLRAEAGGTGQPAFEKFKALYESTKDRLGDICLQFHPPRFTDSSFVAYEQILGFLQQEGWTFMQPREYLASLDGTPGFVAVPMTLLTQP